MQTILLQVCSTGIALKDRGAIVVLQHPGPQFWGPAIVRVLYVTETCTIFDHATAQQRYCRMKPKRKENQLVLSSYISLEYRPF